MGYNKLDFTEVFVKCNVNSHHGTHSLYLLIDRAVIIRGIEVINQLMWENPVLTSLRSPASVSIGFVWKFIFLHKYLEYQFFMIYKSNKYRFLDVSELQRPSLLPKHFLKKYINKKITIFSRFFDDFGAWHFWLFGNLNGFRWISRGSGWKNSF